MAKNTVTLTTTLGEEFLYTTFDKYVLDEYRDGTSRYTQRNNNDRVAVVKPYEGGYEVCLMDEVNGDEFFTTGYVRFTTLRDATLIAKSWVSR